MDYVEKYGMSSYIAANLKLLEDNPDMGILAAENFPKILEELYNRKFPEDYILTLASKLMSNEFAGTRRKTIEALLKVNNKELFYSMLEELSRKETDSIVHLQIAQFIHDHVERTGG